MAYRASGAASGLSHYLSLLAAAYGRIGQATQGLAVLAEAMAIEQETGRYAVQAGLSRLQGELLLRQAVGRDGVQTALSPGEIETALLAEAPPSVLITVEACFRRALTLARQQAAKSLELHVGTSLSRLWQRQGKREEARQMLAKIYSWFTEGFDTRGLREAQALLKDLS
ncbi:MAG TPA: hypothetical protein VKJ47_03230 [Candidatus Binatia bacterium]|nr:hypothetical protein [Candidatus Binatia bacterium]